jgi:GT2 family glycosyltransferase
VTPVRVEVLLTCHNRVDRTIACLDRLFSSEVAGVDLGVIVVDAGSSDGTAAAIHQRHPQVDLLTRGSDLFWNGGMRVAMAEAHRRDPDHYVWLNDDVEVDEDAVARLVRCHRDLERQHQSPAIVVGSTRDPATGQVTYGGVVRPSRLRPLHYSLIEPRDEPRRVETMNGNCVLLPRDVVERVGNLAAAYTHGMGDYDYGHRAVRAGCEVWVAPGTFGTCSRNPAAARAETFSQEGKRLTSPTGGLPPAEWALFARRWAGPLWPIYAASPYVRRAASWALNRRQ